MLLAIPKGRIIESFLKKNKYIKINNINSRKIIFNTNIRKIKILPYKCLDYKLLKKKKKIDVFIIGNDIYEEYEKKKSNYYKLNLFKCRLSVITKNSFKHVKNYLLKKKILIFTKYTKTTKKYFSKKKIKEVIVKKINGSCECAIVLKFSKIIVDIVQTSNTILENNLIEIHKIKNIFPIIIFKNKNKIKNKKKLLKILNV